MENQTKTTPRLRRLLRNSAVWLGLLLGAAGCNPYHFDQSQPIAEHTWVYGQPLSFEFEIQDTSVLYNVLIDVEHGTEYAFENLYCQLRVEAPDQEPRFNKVSFELADKKGDWFGKCSGKTCVIPLVFMQNASFDRPGRYRMVFEQFSRQDSMPEVYSLRLKVQKSEIKRGELPQRKG